MSRMMIDILAKPCSREYKVPKNNIMQWRHVLELFMNILYVRYFCNFYKTFLSLANAGKVMHSD